MSIPPSNSCPLTLTAPPIKAQVAHHPHQCHTLHWSSIMNLTPVQNTFQSAGWDLYRNFPVGLKLSRTHIHTINQCPDSSRKDNRQWQWGNVCTTLLTPVKLTLTWFRKLHYLSQFFTAGLETYGGLCCAPTTWAHFKSCFYRSLAFSVFN